MLEFISAALDYKADKAQYKANKAYQTYRNTMTNLSNAVSQNAITNNELLSNSAFVRQAIQLRKAAMQTEGAVAVAAASAGVKGKSVNQVVLSVQRSAAEQERERQIQLETSWLSFDQQRQNSQLSAAMQQDYTYIPKPKASTYFIKAAIKTAQSAAGMYGGGSDGSLGSSFSMGNFGSSVLNGNTFGQSVGAAYSASPTGPYLNFGSRQLSGYNL